MKISTALEQNFYEQGFTPQTDLFQRSDLADRLSHLFSNLQHGTVSILDGRWGTGKTVFAKQWVHDLKAKGVGAIYFDAFASDYVSDPFQAISGVFVKAAADAKKTKTAVYKRFLSNAARASRKMGVTAAKIGAKIVTVGVIGSSEIEQLNEIKDDLVASAGDLTEDAAKKLLEEHAGSEATFAALRQSIAELPTLFAPDAEGAAQASLVIIIDELDRCRPDFALGVLEILKHFFHAEQVHFVLVTNRDYLIRSVEKRYGLADGSSEYIQKYYDFVIHFESASAESRGTDSAIYADHVLRKLLPAHVPPNDANAIIDCLKAIAEAYDLTLRQTERLVTNVVLAYLAIKEREFRPASAICFLAALKALRPDIYTAIKLRRFSYGDFVAWTGAGKWPHSFPINRMRVWFEFFGNPSINPNDEQFKDMAEGAAGFAIFDRLDVLPHLANVVVDRFGKV